MTAEDFVVNDSGDGQAVEAVRERFPQLDREPSFAFIVKPINSEYNLHHLVHYHTTVSSLD